MELVRHVSPNLAKSSDMVYPLESKCQPKHSWVASCCLSSLSLPPYNLLWSFHLTVAPDLPPIGLSLHYPSLSHSHDTSTLHSPLLPSVAVQSFLLIFPPPWWAAVSLCFTLQRPWAKGAGEAPLAPLWEKPQCDLRKDAQGCGHAVQILVFPSWAFLLLFWLCPR